MTEQQQFDKELEEEREREEEKIRIQEQVSMCYRDTCITLRP